MPSICLTCKSFLVFAKKGLVLFMTQRNTAAAGINNKMKQSETAISTNKYTQMHTQKEK